MRLRHATAFIIMILSATWLWSQASSQESARMGGRLSGRITYPNGVAAAYVRVQVRSDAVAYQTEGTTDVQGKYDFSGLPRSGMRLIVEVNGYQPISKYADLSTVGMAYEDIVLRPLPGTTPPIPTGETIDARVAAIPKEASKEFETGQKAMDSKDLPGAIAHFQKAIDLYPRYAEAYQLMGLAQLQSGKGAEAEAAFSKAVEIEDKLANAQYLLGITRAMMGHADLAEKPMQRFVELSPENPDGHFELAKVTFALNRFTDSETHARKAIELKEKNPGVHMVLAYALLRQNKLADAKAEFKSFLSLDPNGPAAADVKNTIAMIEQHEKK